MYVCIYICIYTYVYIYTYIYIYIYIYLYKYVGLHVRNQCNNNVWCEYVIKQHWNTTLSKPNVSETSVITMFCTAILSEPMENNTIQAQRVRNQWNNTYIGWTHIFLFCWGKGVRAWYFNKQKRREKERKRNQGFHFCTFDL